MFRYSAGSWTEQVKLTAPEGEAFDNFGISAISGNTLVIGASGDDDAALNAGAVYVYEFDGTDWNLLTKLTANDAAPDDVFGTTVSISGNSMIVGAPHFYSTGIYSGAAYIFSRTSGVWTQEDKLTPSDGFVGDAYGFGVDVEGTTAIVTADRDDDFGVDTGSMYVYSKTPTGWMHVQKITASDAPAEGWFGTRVEIEGSTAIASAWQIFDFVTNSGSVYTFEIDTDDDGIFDALDNCPTVPNTDQVDVNGDGFGDECVDPSVDIPNNSDVDPTVEIGEGTSLNSGVTIEENVVLEENVSANQNVTINEGTTIQEGASLNQGSQVGAQSTIGPNVVIGKNVFIGENVVIGANTVIGQGSYICSGSTVAADLDIGKNNAFLPGSNVTENVEGLKNPVSVPPDPC